MTTKYKMLFYIVTKLYSATRSLKQIRLKLHFALKQLKSAVKINSGVKDFFLKHHAAMKTWH